MKKKAERRDDGSTGLHLLQRFFEEMFAEDERGRMRVRRCSSLDQGTVIVEATPGLEALGAAVPRFVFGRSRTGNVWRFRQDLAATMVRDLSRLAGREDLLIEDPGLAAPPERLENLLQVLRRSGSESRVQHALLCARGAEGRALAELYFFP